MQIVFTLLTYFTYKTKVTMRCAALHEVYPKRNVFSVGVWSRCSQCQNVASEMAGCSTDAVRLQQNVCHHSCCVFLEQCMFWCLRNEAGDGHFQTAGECRLPDTSVRNRIIPDTRVRTCLRTTLFCAAVSVFVHRCTWNMLSSLLSSDPRVLWSPLSSTALPFPP